MIQMIQQFVSWLSLYFTTVNFVAVVTMAMLVLVLVFFKKLVLWSKVNTVLEWITVFIGIYFLATQWVKFFLHLVVEPTLKTGLAIPAFGMALAFVLYGVSKQLFGSRGE